jgi:putative glutamine amidotransferase
MMKPRVLVTLNAVEVDGRPTHQVREHHLRALRAAGLLPVLAAGSLALDELDALQEMCQALYLPGGDYVPEWLGESDDESARAAQRAGLTWDPLKVRADLHLLGRAWARGIPTLGVCGGFQAMVIRAGGSLRCCAEGELARHASVTEAEPFTAVGPVTAEVFDGGCAGNSFHRQTVRELEGPLAVGATSADGLVEAVEAPPERHPFWLGLQWHPELLDDLRPYWALREAAGRPPR